MATRIETKHEATVKLSALPLHQLFVFPGEVCAYQMCLKSGTVYTCYSFMLLRMTSLNKDQDVIPIDRTDLVKGEWRVKERGLTIIDLELLDIGATYRIPQKDEVWQRGDIWEDSEKDFHAWNVSLPTRSYKHWIKMLVVPLKQLNPDPDGTIVFTEL